MFLTCEVHPYLLKFLGAYLYRPLTPLTYSKRLIEVFLIHYRPINHYVDVIYLTLPATTLLKVQAHIECALNYIVTALREGNNLFMACRWCRSYP